MSTIQIEVPLEALSRPGVAKALADLALSLGGQQGRGDVSATALRATEARATREAPAARAEAPAAAPAEAAPSRGNGKAGRGAASRGALKAAEPARATRGGARRGGGQTTVGDENWQKYLEALPETSRRFLSLLEEKGTMTVGEAVDALGLDSPKAMGGLTGAMRRWAPRQNVELPFEAGQNAEGQRYWKWTGRR
jgi:hypothetical protein